MKVSYDVEEQVRFGGLKPGDCFELDGDIMIKTESRSEDTYNAADVRTGIRWTCGGDVVVIPLPDAIIYPYGGPK